MSQNPSTPIKAGAQVALGIGALGVVFGDIGTSPLYTIRECLASLPPSEHSVAVLGVLSLIVWSLIMVVSVKYTIFVLRADNRGEGGVFALLALGHFDRGVRSGLSMGTLVVLIGAAMLCGEAVITPAITVLGAVEGIKLVWPGVEHLVVPLSCVILFGLFLFQYRGTKFIGGIFGPVMLVGFFVLGVLGLWRVIETPIVLRALDPRLGIDLVISHPTQASVLLGAVVLAFTGVEALYADMGHFGRKAITTAWYAVVLPGLTLNYFGQGAFFLSGRGSVENPFLAIAPEGPIRYGLLALSVLAAIIASQALISGAYSLIRQAIQLGYFPRLSVQHTNPDQRGQIYLPLVNTDRIDRHRARIQVEHQPGRGVRHRGDGHDDRYNDRAVLRDAAQLEVAGVAGGGGVRALPGRRPDLLLGQPAQIPRRRLAAPGHCARASGNHGDVEARQV